MGVPPLVSPFKGQHTSPSPPEPNPGRPNVNKTRDPQKNSLSLATSGHRKLSSRLFFGNRGFWRRVYHRRTAEIKNNGEKFWPFGHLFRLLIAVPSHYESWNETRVVFRGQSKMPFKRQPSPLKSLGDHPDGVCAIALVASHLAF